MKNNKIIRIIRIAFLFLLFTGLVYVVNADMGNKPSINIKIKNITTDNYLIDLFEYAETNEDYYPDSNYSSSDYTKQRRVYTKGIIDEGIIDKNGIKVYFEYIAEQRRN